MSAKVSGYSDARAARATPVNRSPPVRLPFKRRISASPAEPANTAFFQFSIFFLRSARTFGRRVRARWYVLVISVSYTASLELQLWRTWMRKLNRAMWLSALLFWTLSVAAQNNPRARDLGVPFDG